jgi:hypothetical protein
MKTERAITMLLMVGLLALAMTFTMQRPARASDTGKIIGAIAAAVIVHEILDDDDHNPAYCRPPYGKAYGYYRQRPSCVPYRGYGGWQPAPRVYGAPVYYGEPARPGLHIDVRKGPNGKTSVGIGYRDYRW